MPVLPLFLSGKQPAGEKSRAVRPESRRKRQFRPVQQGLQGLHRLHQQDPRLAGIQLQRSAEMGRRPRSRPQGRHERHPSGIDARHAPLDERER